MYNVVGARRPQARDHSGRQLRPDSRMERGTDSRQHGVHSSWFAAQLVWGSQEGRVAGLPGERSVRVASLVGVVSAGVCVCGHSSGLHLTCAVCVHLLYLDEASLRAECVIQRSVGPGPGPTGGPCGPK